MTLALVPMKYLVSAILAIPLIACSAAPPIKEQALLALPNGKFIVAGITTDLAGAIARLGPPDTTQVDLTFCPSMGMGTAVKIVGAFKAAGYGHVGFTPPEAAEMTSCANSAPEAAGSSAVSPVHRSP